jgi:hypothetical protein
LLAITTLVHPKLLNAPLDIIWLPINHFASVAEFLMLISATSLIIQLLLSHAYQDTITMISMIRVLRVVLQVFQGVSFLGAL